MKGGLALLHQHHLDGFGVLGGYQWRDVNAAKMGDHHSPHNKQKLHPRYLHSLTLSLCFCGQLGKLDQ